MNGGDVLPTPITLAPERNRRFSTDVFLVTGCNRPTSRFYPPPGSATMDPKTELPRGHDMPDIASLSFLVVDDEAFILKLATRVLGQMGATDIATATDGQAALDQLEAATTPPDVMLIDLSMPGMGGPELLRHLADREYGGAVVLVSGADAETLEFAQGMAQHRETNVLGYIVKPLKPDALTELLNKLG